jgi:Skp family chaperone for outer membrane proteins
MFAAFALALVAAGAFSQQIVKVAVVDFMRVYNSFVPESKEWKAFEEKKAKVEAEVAKMKEEIKALQTQKAEAEKSGNAAEAAKIQVEIDKKIEAFKKYYSDKDAELKADEAKLKNNTDLIETIYKAIQHVAEQEGYMLVLNSNSVKEVNGELLWYSPVVDLTQKVIDYLKSKAKGK